MLNAIATDQLTRRYGRHLAVDRLSLHVEPGQIYGFLGLNGAGKSTTIRLLLGLLRPSAGTAHLLGQPVRPDALTLWARVGALVERSRAYPDLTVRENLEVVRRLRRVTDPAVVPRLLEQLHLAGQADQRAGTLSLGNAQRLGLAAALLHEPELLLLDEPTNGLDPAAIVEVRQLLLELAHRRGVTIFMSSHLLSEVTRLAGRIGILHDGRLVEELTAAELAQRRQRWLVVDAHDRAAARASLLVGGLTATAAADGRLRLADARAVAAPERVASLLVAAGQPPTRLAVEHEELEAYFLRLVGTATAAPR